jgi:hypothetical protein
LKITTTLIGVVTSFSVATFSDLKATCYAQAVSKNGKVYLATATAKESQWATVGDTLRKHIDGFKAD